MARVIPVPLNRINPEKLLSEIHKNYKENEKSNLLMNIIKSVFDLKYKNLFNSVSVDFKFDQVQYNNTQIEYKKHIDFIGDYTSLLSLETSTDENNYTEDSVFFISDLFKYKNNKNFKFDNFLIWKSTYSALGFVQMFYLNNKKKEIIQLKNFLNNPELSIYIEDFVINNIDSENKLEIEYIKTENIDQLNEISISIFQVSYK